jgi:hypothetical protein
VGQFAGERGQRKLGRLRKWGRPSVLNCQHLGFPPGNEWVGNPEMLAAHGREALGQGGLQWTQP